MRTSRDRDSTRPFRFSTEWADSATQFDTVFADERIGGPLDRERRQSLPWLGIASAVSACVYLIFFQVGVDWPNPVQAAPQQAAVAQAQAPALPLEQSEPALASTSLPPIINTTPSPTVATEETETTPAVEPSEQPDATATETAATPPVQPLPPPVVDKSDPYQVRALAAGLHPGLSRALLVRLTKTDFKNAAHAIRTALAKTPDDKVFVWPRGRSKKVTRFQVRFVPSISSECRRYIVEVDQGRLGDDRSGHGEVRSQTDDPGPQCRAGQIDPLALE